MFTNICQNFLVADENLRKEFDVLFEVIRSNKFDNGEIAYEGLINRQIGEKVYQFIKWDLDITPHYTVKPNDPTDLSLEKRAEFVNSFDKNTTLLISVHSNAFNTKARGFEKV